ncbi:zinc finger protein 34-like [Tupaia chinensis]|uniref:zinc finger protein 34-like n=1 Tax=Tupaia chinensis TaxID=246437 RepID=UPI00070423CD|nr:zinc finger protein 34-like [Tupaia chinensis]
MTLGLKKLSIYRQGQDLEEDLVTEIGGGGAHARTGWGTPTSRRTPQVQGHGCQLGWTDNPPRARGHSSPVAGFQLRGHLDATTRAAPPRPARSYPRIPAGWTEQSGAHPALAPAALGRQRKFPRHRRRCSGPGSPRSLGWVQGRGAEVAARVAPDTVPGDEGSAGRAPPRPGTLSPYSPALDPGGGRGGRRGRSCRTLTSRPVSQIEMKGLAGRIKIASPDPSNSHLDLQDLAVQLSIGIEVAQLDRKRLCVGVALKEEDSQCGENISLIPVSNLNEKPLPGEKPCESSVCGECIAVHSSLDWYIRTHQGEKAHECQEYAEKPFNHKQYGKSFVSLMTYECPQCGKTFSCSFPEETVQRCDDQDHERTHTREKPYECKQCGKAFSFSSSLQKHGETHTGKNSYECPQCGKIFSHSRSVRDHERTHIGEKPYEWYERTHTGEKPYECKECGNTFSCPRVHTGDKPDQCKQCLLPDKIMKEDTGDKCYQFASELR